MEQALKIEGANGLQEQSASGTTHSAACKAGSAFGALVLLIAPAQFPPPVNERGSSMTSVSLHSCNNPSQGCLSMQEPGEVLIEALPRHISMLIIPGRWLTEAARREPVPARIARIEEIQDAMHEVLCDAITQTAQNCAKGAFSALLEKERADPGFLHFFNGWNETHKTTSWVSGKIIMRLAADALHISLVERGD